MINGRLCLRRLHQELLSSIGHSPEGKPVHIRHHCGPCGSLLCIFSNTTYSRNDSNEANMSIRRLTTCATFAEAVHKYVHELSIVM